jgi:hypothetical protein
MIDVTDRKIWVFREARSGSLVFTNWLSRVVDKPMHSVESVEDMVDDNSLLFHSHNFEMLRELKEEENPIIFRCSRKDKGEQLLSRIAHEHTGLANINNGTSKAELEHYLTVTQNQNITVTVSQVLSFLHIYHESDNLWNEYAPKFISQVVYYEDGAGNIDLPGLELYDFDYNYGNDKWFRKFSGSYKKNFYSNYNHVKELLRMYFK